jgi:hypothetical protein
MSKRVLAFPLLAALGCLAAVSCVPLEKAPDPTGLIPPGTLEPRDAIPLEFGDLVAVTMDQSRPDLAHLWFQKPDKSIVIVFMDYNRGQLRERVFTVPRR